MDYNLKLQDIKDWIKGLIIVQYHQSPKNQALIDLLVELIFANNLILQIRDLCLSVDNSIGAQLDVVARWVGMDRYFNAVEVWDRPYLAYPYYETIRNDSYDEYQGGFSTYTNFADNDGGFLMYEDWKKARTQTNQLPDDKFRELIKLKIIQNSINHTKKNIDDAIWTWSNGEVYTTWNNPMEIEYNFPKEKKEIIFLADYKNILPHPTGCKIILKETT